MWPTLCGGLLLPLWSVLLFSPEISWASLAPRGRKFSLQVESCFSHGCIFWLLNDHASFWPPTVALHFQFGSFLLQRTLYHLPLGLGHHDYGCVRALSHLHPYGRTHDLCSPLYQDQFFAFQLESGILGVGQQSPSPLYNIFQGVKIL